VDVLIVDDSRAMLMSLRTMLEKEHKINVTALTNPSSALIEAQVRAFDLILVDHHMPEMDGTTFIQRMRAMPHYAQVPIIMVTSDVNDAVRLAALEAGASDFLDKSKKGIEMSVRLRNQIQLAAAVRRLDNQAAWLAGEIEKAVRQLREREEEIIFRLALAVEYRDNDTGDHTWRVARYSQIIAEALGLNPDLCHRIYLAAPLHDVGKVAVPDGILLKRGPLTPQEFAVVRTHSTVGRRILEDSASELIQLAAEIAEAHHEKWDGSGYPHGLAGEAIPLSARIVAVADVFDALTTVRPYKASMPAEEALRHLCADSALHFDPSCIAAFISRWPDILAASAMTTTTRETSFRRPTEPWARVPELLCEARNNQELQPSL